MGVYINPPTGTKEEFLVKFGQPTTLEAILAMKEEVLRSGEGLPVVILYNGEGHTNSALGVIWDERTIGLVTRQVLKVIRQAIPAAPTK